MLVERNTKDHYFINLIRELNNQGIKVDFPRKAYKRLFLFRNLLFSKSKILHLHFLYSAGFYTLTPLKFISKYLIFIIDIFLVKYILKTRIIWTIHNLYSHHSRFPILEKLGRKFFAKKVDLIICHCENAKILVQKEFGVSPSKIHIIPHGNYIQSYKNTISREKAREILHLSNNDFVFLFFGRIRPYKGVGKLITSFKSIYKNNNLKLLIVGKVFSDEIRNLIIKSTQKDNRIILKLERIPDDEIQFYMNASDIIVTPYRDVLTSGQVILAMSFSKPIIAPKLGCIIDILDEKGSILYHSKTESGLALALKKSLEIKANLAEMGNYNFNVLKNYDWKSISAKTLELYQKLLK